MSAIGHVPIIADPGVIAIAGDWHGNTPWAQKVLDVCAEQGVRTVLHLGDFGLWPGPSGKLYLNRLEEHLVRNDQTIYWVDGNHDDHGRLDSLRPKPNGMRRIRDRIWHLPRGFRWTWHDRTWLALGGAHSVDRQARIPDRSWWPREVVSPEEEMRAIDGGPADVMVCHDAPLGVPRLEQWLAPNVYGWAQEELHFSYLHRQLIRRVVDAVRPAVLYHGHYHWRYDDELLLDDGHTVRVSGLDAAESGLTRNFFIVDAATLAPPVAV